jgi:murein DD-endopeptidase MepM/ murein hydrolase activator NlpD
MMYDRILFNSKQLGRLALLGLVMAMSACGGGDSTGTASSPTTGPTAVLGANEVAPVSGQPVVVGPETGGVAFAPGDAAQNSIPTLTRVKNLDLSTLFDAEKSTLMTEGAADYEILIKFPLFPTGDSTITVTVPDALASKVTDSNAVVAYLLNGDIDEPSPFEPLASDYDPSTKKLAFVIPKGYLSDSAPGEGAAGKANIKLGLATAFEPEPSTTTVQTKSVGTSAFQTAQAPKKLPCPVAGSDGCIETSRLGPRIGGSSPLHKGVDFRARTPTKLFAVADGIIEIPKGTEWGTVDIVSGLTRYRYLHLSETEVKNGQKVNAKDPIGLSGNKAPPKKKDGTPLIIGHHLHFEIWRSEPLPTVSKKTKWIITKVDPFPYFVDKLSIDIPGTTVPSNTTVGKSFALALKGYDIDGRPVITEINNNTSFIEAMRSITWAASTGTALNQEKTRDSYHQSLGPYKIGLDPSKRNLADIAMPSSEINATITAVWEGVSPAAKYSLNSAPTAAITGAMSDSATKPGAISNGASTDDSTPTLSGTLSTALNNGQRVNLYDGTTLLTSSATVTGTNWTFTPTNALTLGTHIFSAAVAASDGTVGEPSATFAITTIDNTPFSFVVNDGASSYHYRRECDTGSSYYGGYWCQVFHALNLTINVSGPVSTAINSGNTIISCGQWKAEPLLYKGIAGTGITCIRDESSPSTTQIVARTLAGCGGEGCFPYSMDFYRFYNGRFAGYLYRMTTTPVQFGEVYTRFPTPWDGSSAFGFF